MSNAKLILTFDVIYPSVFAHQENIDWAENYHHEENNFYFVLQPYLRLTKDGNAHTSLQEYFNWTADDLLSGNEVAFADENVLNNTDKYVPVPLPPGIEISFNGAWQAASGETLPFESSRILGEVAKNLVETDSPFLLPKSLLGDFTKVNYNAPIVKRFAHLTESQQKSALDWVCSTIVSLKEKSDRNDSQLLFWEPDAIKLLVQNLVPELNKPFWELLFEPKLSNGSDTKIDLNLWHQWLMAPLTNNKSMAETLFDYYAQLKAHNEDQKQQLSKVSLLREFYDPTMLDLFGQVVLEDSGISDSDSVTHISHHLLFWTLYQQKLATMAADQIEEAEQELGRQSAFGERLRWPKQMVQRNGQDDPNKLQHFMTLEQLSKRETDIPWFTTNYLSLMGQVWQTKLISDTDSNQSFVIDSFKLKSQQTGEVLDVAAADTKNSLKKMAKTLLENVVEFKVNNIIPKAKLVEDGEFPNGLVFFKPQADMWTPLASKGENGETFVEFPQALLDLLTPESRESNASLTNEQSEHRKLVSYNPQRISVFKSDLFRPELTLVDDPSLTAYLRVPVSIKALASFEKEDKFFEMTMGKALHMEEASQIAGILNGFGENRLSGSLVGKKDNNIFLIPIAPIEKCKIVDAAFKFKLHDVDKKIEEFLAQNDGNETGQELMLAIEVAPNQPLQNQPFNLISFQDESKNILSILKRHFVSRTSRSTDRINERFDMILEPSPFAEQNAQNNTAVIDDLYAFQKLRLGALDPTFDISSLDSSNAVDGRGSQNLYWFTQPDAMTPLPDEEEDFAELDVSIYPNERGREGEFYSYFLSHIFSQEIKESPAETENLRFASLKNAGEGWKMLGLIEHQTGYRMPIVDAPTIPLQLSTSVKHPADMSTGETQSDGKSLTAFGMTYDYMVIDSKECIVVDFNRVYFSKMLALANGLDNRQESPSKLRDIYESLLEIRLAISETQESRLKLILERWNFQNDAKGASTDPEAQFPSIQEYMRRVQVLTFNLANVKEQFSPLLSLLEGEFGDFKTNLQVLLNDTVGSEEICRIILPLEGFNESLSNVEEGETLFEKTNAIRVGLDVKRPVNSVIGKRVLSGKFVPFIAQENDDNFLSILNEQDYDSMTPEVEKQLRSFVDAEGQASNLHTRFEWLISRNKNTNQELESVNSSVKNLSNKLFGGLEQWLNFPEKSRKELELAIRMYYVPYAFAPLKTHPAFLDINTTRQFTQFLAGVIYDFVNGEKSSLLAIEYDQISAQELDASRQSISELLVGENGLAQQLVKLLAPVHNYDAVLANGDEKEVNLFKFVTNLAIENEDAIKSELQARLSKNPKLYTKNKAIASCIVEPETDSERLYSMQIHKRIVKSNRRNNNRRDDTDRFTFARLIKGDTARFWLDMLDDENYDNEFEITSANKGEIEFEPDGNSPGGAKLLKRRDILHRGAVQVRLAEDLIEQSNHFTVVTDDGNDGVGDGLRLAEGHVLHYNPDWKIKRADADETYTNNEVYLLPSRQAPATPTVVIPENAGGDTSNTSSIKRSNLIAPWTEVNSLTELESTFEPTISAALLEKTELSFQQMGEEIPMQIKRVDEHSEMNIRSLAIQNVESKREGWYHTESYLSHYYFVVNADEEQVNTDTLIANDAFEIEVEVARKPYKFQASTVKKKELKSGSILIDNFKFHKELSEGDSKQQNDNKPSPIKNAEDLSELVKEINAWIKEPDTFREYTQSIPLIRPRGVVGQPTPAASTADQYIRKTKSLYQSRPSVSGNLQQWELRETDVQIDASNSIETKVGSVMSAEIFQFESTDTDETRDYSRLVVRISVLDEPYFFTRARLKIRRNARDFDADNTPDINPVFEMVTPSSAWSTYGLQTLNLKAEKDFPDTIPDELKSLDVIKNSQHDVPSLKDWLTKLDKPFWNLGPVVKTNIDFKQKLGDDYANLWHQTEAKNQTINIQGYVYQDIPDRFYLHQLSGSHSNKIEERRSQFGRQFLEPVKGDSIGDLVNKINPELVPGSEFRIKVVWMNDVGHSLMEIDWPVVFEHASNVQP